MRSIELTPCTESCDCPTVCVCPPVPECIPFTNDIFLLVDGSESIRIADYERLRAFSVRLFGDLDLNPSQAALGEFSSDIVILSDEFTANSDELMLASARLEQSQGLTNTGTALEAVNDFFDEHSDPNNQRVLIVITDGKASLAQQELLTSAVEEFHAAIPQSVAFSIGINPARVNQDELEFIAGPRGSTFVLNSFSELDIEATITSLIANASTDHCEIPGKPAVRLHSVTRIQNPVGAP